MMIALAALWAVGWLQPSVHDIERGRGVCADSVYAVFSPIHSGPLVDEVASSSTVIVRIDAMLPVGSSDLGTGVGYLYYSADGVPRLGGRSARAAAQVNPPLQRLLHVYAADVGVPEATATIFTGTQALMRFAVTDEELSSVGLVRKSCVEWPKDKKLPFEH